MINDKKSGRKTNFLPGISDTEGDQSKNPKWLALKGAIQRKKTAYKEMVDLYGPKKS